MRAEVNEIKDRLHGVESRLGDVETRLGAVETRLGAVEERVGKTMVAVARLTGDVADLKETAATKDDVRRGFSRIMDRLDELMPWTEAVKRDRE